MTFSLVYNQFMPRAIALDPGTRYGRLVVTRRADTVGHPQGVRWHCVCDCGTHVTVPGRSLRTGNTQSCGCLQRETVAALLTTHGESRRGAWTPEFQAWAALRRRCLNPRYRGYKDYGGRGITVCDRWESFEAFLQDMGRRPSADHSVDRINNDGPYSPDNCRWATRSQQQLNKRIYAKHPARLRVLRNIGRI